MPMEVSNTSTRLVEYFAVVGVDDEGEIAPAPGSEGEVEAGLVNARLLSRYPEQDHSQVPFPYGLPVFCFPKGGATLLEGIDVPKFFEFVSTGENGAWLYGFVLKIYEPVDPSRYTEEMQASGKSDYHVPKCLCILSHWPFRDQFLAFLLQIYRISISSSSLPLERFISNFVSEVPLPPPGLVRVQYHIGDTELEFSRPPANNPIMFYDSSFQNIFECLDTKNLLRVFSALLTERQIIVRSSQLSLLGAFGRVCTTLMYPFSWSHVFIPVLPAQMLMVLHAPLPFLIGIQEETLRQALQAGHTLPPTAVVVNLDENTVFASSHELNALDLPQREGKKLAARLNQCAPAFEQRSPTWTRDVLPNIDYAVGQVCKPCEVDKVTAMNMRKLVHAENDDDFFGSSEKSVWTTLPNGECNWPMVRMAFFQFFTALLRDYREFLVYPVNKPSKASGGKRTASWVDDRAREQAQGSFDRVAFLARRKKPGERVFLTAFLQTLHFSSFIDNILHPDGARDADVIFFEQSLTAKLNRSFLSRVISSRKTETPFLDDPRYAISKTFVALAPDHSGISGQVWTAPGQGGYERFPRLNVELYGEPRPMPELFKPSSDMLALNRKSHRGTGTSLFGNHGDSSKGNRVQPATASQEIYATWFLLFCASIGRNIPYSDVAVHEVIRLHEELEQDPNKFDLEPVTARSQGSFDSGASECTIIDAQDWYEDEVLNEGVDEAKENVKQTRGPSSARIDKPTNALVALTSALKSERPTQSEIERNKIEMSRDDRENGGPGVENQMHPVQLEDQDYVKPLGEKVVLPPDQVTEDVSKSKSGITSHIIEKENQHSQGPDLFPKDKGSTRESVPSVLKLATTTPSKEESLEPGEGAAASPGIDANASYALPSPPSVTIVSTSTHHPETTTRARVWSTGSRAEQRIAANSGTELDIEAVRLDFALDQLELAFEVLEASQHWCDGTPKEVVYRALIDACGRCGHTDYAIRVLGMMHEAGIMADSLVYSNLVRSFSMNGDINHSLKLDVINWDKLSEEVTAANRRIEASKRTFSRRSTSKAKHVLGARLLGHLSSNARLAATLGQPGRMTEAEALEHANAIQNSKSSQPSYLPHTPLPSVRRTLRQWGSRRRSRSNSSIQVPYHAQPHANGRAQTQGQSSGGNGPKLGSEERRANVAQGGGGAHHQQYQFGFGKQAQDTGASPLRFLGMFAPKKSPKRGNDVTLNAKIPPSPRTALEDSPSEPQSSTSLSPTEHGTLDLGAVFPGLVFNLNRETCPQCQVPVNDEDIRRGWNATDPNDYNTICPQCGRKFVAYFTCFSEHPSWQGSRGPQSELFCEFLPPWALHKETRTILAHHGIGFVCTDTFRKTKATVFWNLILYFSEFNLPIHFLLLHSHDDPDHDPNTPQDNASTPDTSARVPA